MWPHIGHSQHVSSFVLSFEKCTEYLVQKTKYNSLINKKTLRLKIFKAWDLIPVENYWE